MVDGDPVRIVLFFDANMSFPSIRESRGFVGIRVAARPEVLICADGMKRRFNEAPDLFIAQWCLSVILDESRTRNGNSTPRYILVTKDRKFTNAVRSLYGRYAKRVLVPESLQLSFEILADRAGGIIRQGAFTLEVFTIHDCLSGRKYEIETAFNHARSLIT